MNRFAYLGAALALGSTMAIAASTPQERLDKEIGGWMAGPPERCIDLRRVTATAAYGDTMLFKVRSSIKYRTESSGCPAQRVGLTITTNSDHGKLCSGDVVGLQDIDNDMIEGSCQIGEFTPYRRN